MTHLLLTALILAAPPLAARAAAAQAPAAEPDWSTATRVEVVLADFSFTPETLELQAGRPYAISLVNKGSGGHSFSAPAFFDAARLAPGQAAALSKGTVNLARGETRVITLVPAAGTWTLRCTHFLHAGFGMKGSIVVRPASAPGGPAA